MKLRELKFVAVALIATGSLLIAGGMAQAAPSANGLANANQNASFWTADKVNSAKSFDMVMDGNTGVGKRIESVARASGGSKTTDSTTQLWSNSTDPVAKITGKVFFSIGTAGYVCSGSLVNDNGARAAIVLTAGHCVFDNATSSYVTKFVFVPNYAFNDVRTNGCNQRAWLCWSAPSLFANAGFTSQTKFTAQATQYDWGFAVLADNGSGFPDVAGSYVLEVNTNKAGSVANAFGYPQASPYDGSKLYYSTGVVGTDTNNGNKTYKLGSLLTGGASGGPWYFNFGSSPLAASLNSYKYSTGNYMYGPKFNSNTLATFSQALAAAN